MRSEATGDLVGDHEVLATRGEHTWFSVAAARAARRRSSAADHGNCALLRGAWAAAKEQAALGLALVQSRSLGSVMIVVWIAALGGSIQVCVQLFRCPHAGI